MEDKVISDLKLLSGVYKIFAYLLSLGFLILSLLYRYAFALNKSDDSFIANYSNDLDIIYFVITILISFIIAISLYKKSTECMWKVLMLKKD